MALNYKSSLVRYRRYLAAAEADPAWKASLFVILSLVLLLFMILFAIRPTVITIADLVSQIREQEQLSQRYAAKIETVRDASEILSQQRDKIGLLDQGLPITPVWLDWVSSVEKLATDSGIVLESVTTGPVSMAGKVAAPNTTNTGSSVLGKGLLANSLNQVIDEVAIVPPGVTGIGFTVVAGGDYQELKSFIESIEKLRRITIINNIEVSKNKEGEIKTAIKGSFGYMINNNEQ